MRQIRLVWKPLVFLLCLAPAIHVVTDLFEITGKLGANPVEAMQDRFGTWGIRFIMLTLAVTPLRKIYRVELARAFSSHAGSVHILLRTTAFPGLAAARAEPVFSALAAGHADDRRGHHRSDPT